MLFRRCQDLYYILCFYHKMLVASVFILVADSQLLVVQIPDNLATAKRFRLVREDESNCIKERYELPVKVFVFFIFHMRMIAYHSVDVNYKNYNWWEGWIRTSTLLCWVDVTPLTYLVCSAFLPSISTAPSAAWYTIADSPVSGSYPERASPKRWAGWLLTLSDILSRKSLIAFQPRFCNLPWPLLYF